MNDLLKFTVDHFEENSCSEDKLIALDPVGITLNMDPSRPVLIFKSRDQKATFPVMVSPLEAGLALGMSRTETVFATNSHGFLEKILESLSIRVMKVVFVEIKNSVQYVRVYLEGHPSYGSIKLRADEVMSVALKLQVPCFVVPEVLKKSKSMQVEVETIVKGLAQSQSSWVKPPEGYLQ